MEHTAAGEVGGFTDWADIYAISKKLLDVVSLDPKHGQYLIPIENIMDGESIGKQIYDVVEKKFSAPAQQMRVSHESDYSAV